MEHCYGDATITKITSSSSPSPIPPPPPPVVSPCSACKILRRRCVEKCVLAPYFPPSDPLKFTTAHRVYGASNIIKLLQELPEALRVDAVSSMVYEANARLRDPVYGSAGVISQLQNQVNELQQQLAMAQAEIVNKQSQQANLMALMCMEKWHKIIPHQHHSSDNDYQTNMSFLDESLGSLWEHVWT
ncbi:LOB domain-containing protein 1-like [Olea europaea var. sylvestris]|uniref:LOB domain-containing protein 1-like n=1 Tax=Olea europaea var. sylvestris TaxID=158386 RepID=UPI000C1D8BF3|nr:LOB domain-containing protein 1-like [Olea europaea var. sylvestris]